VGKPLKTAVLVSGGGTNLQVLIDEEHTMNSSGEQCPYEIALVVSSASNAYALERAKKANIPNFVASPSLLLGEKAKNATRDEKRFAVSNKVFELCKEYKIEVIVLAGFLTVLGGSIIDKYAEKIINLHPALLPKFGGVGISGITVHLVDAGCDTGKILLQKRVPVLPNDTPETLYERIAPYEHQAIVEGLKLLAKKLS
jgi:phosphoribosylglycinamide formyltransferase-1